MTGEPWLHEAREWSGHWWLPEAPETTVPGVLRYEPDTGPRLSLIGGFASRIMREIAPGVSVDQGENRTWDVIHGVADNKEVTLLNCLPLSSTSYGMGVGPTAKQSIHAQTALVGVHLTAEDDRVFTGCRVSLEGLTDWSADSVFSMTMGLKDDDKLDGRGTIEATPVDGRSTRYLTTTIRLERHQTLPYFEHRRGSTLGRMTDAAALYVEPDEPASLAELRQTAHAMQDLLSLATHRVSAVLWLTLRMPPEDRERPEGYPVIPRDVSLYAEQRVLGDPLAKALDRGVLFTASDLPFEQVVPRWLGIRGRFAATVNLILGLRYVPGGYLETQLSQAATAAEAMHRALDLDPPIPTEEFKALRKAVLEAVPKERHRWASGLLARNEPSLRTRLLDLAGRPDHEAMEALLPDRARWAKMTVAARNNLAHTGRSTAHDLHELYAVSRVTTAVVLLNLLLEVGLSGERQRAILTGNSELSTACRLSREHCTSGSEGGSG